MPPPSTSAPRARTLVLYVAMVLVGALACVGALFLTDVGDFDRPWLVAVIAVLIAVEGATAVKIAKGRGHSDTQGHEEALLVFMALAFSPIAALVAVTAGALVGDVLARRGALKTVFNVASFGGAGALALIAVNLVAGSNEISVRRVLAVLLGALIFATVTRVAVSGVLAVALGTSFRRDVVEDLRPWALLLAGNASVGLLAGLAALSHAWTVPFAFAAMLALSFAFSGHARARRERRTLDDLVSSSWDGIFSVDGDGLIQLWNPAMSRLSGLAAADVEGKEPAAVLDVRDASGEAWAGFEAASQPDSEAEAVVLRLQTEHGLRWLRISRSPLPAEGYSFIVRDVTAEHDAQESIRDNAERLQLALESGSMGWWEWNIETGEELWSESLHAMFGLAPGEFGGRHQDFLACVHPDDRDLLSQAVERAREDGHFTTATTYRIVWPDGTIRWLEGNGRLLTTDAGTKMIGINRDVTERKQMETNLLHAQKVEAVGTLAAGIAHDFNNMLAAVNGFSELTLRDLAPSHPVRRNVEQIAAAGERAAAISSQLLTFSRKHTAEPEAVDLEQVIAGIEQLLPSILPAGVEIVVVAAPGLGNIRGDTGQLEQVLMNLAVNAGHAMPRGGQLTIEVGNVELDEKTADRLPAGSYVLLGVADTGEGMDDAMRERIFEPFFTTKGRGEGTGLGLSMVAAIVEETGGAISVTSTPGEGTRFELLFPRLHTAAVATRDVPRSLDRSSKTVLLVDDSASVRAFERLVLEDEGYLVLEAGNAAEAIEVAALHDGLIHVLLTDVVMPPHGSGPELARVLASTRPELKVIYISGFSREEITEQGVSANDICLLKPVTRDGLAAAVRGAGRAPLVARAGA